jgi:hypothetical protein
VAFCLALAKRQARLKGCPGPERAIKSIYSFISRSALFISPSAALPAPSPRVFELSASQLSVLSRSLLLSSIQYACLCPFSPVGACDFVARIPDRCGPIIPETRYDLDLFLIPGGIEIRYSRVKTFFATSHISIAILGGWYSLANMNHY